MTVTSIRRVLAILSVVTAISAAVQIAGTASVRAQDYSAILAAPDRSDADKQNDKRRDARKLLTFIGPKTGWMVLDMGAGAGYSTELMARAVGPTGKVWGKMTSPTRNSKRG